MNVIVKLALDAALKYLEAHPDQVEALVSALFDWGVKELTAFAVAKKAA